MTDKNSSKYLIISPSWLGDLIMSQSLLKALKQAEPNCTIDVYAPAYTMPILDRMPEVDHKIINPFDHGQFNLKQRYLEGRKLRSYNYDKVFVLPNSLKSALIALFAKIPQRIGFKGESRYFILNNIRTNKHDFPLMVQRYVALAYSKEQVKTASDLPKIEYPSLAIKPLDQDTISSLNLDLSRKALVLGCGANYGPSKLWPVEYFAKVSNWWIEQGGCVIALGSKKDIPTVENIFKFIDQDKLKYFYNIAGKTNLTQALDIVGASTAAVCNDSGLMHTVAAAGVAQVCIFGSTTTNYTPPLSDKAICIESKEPCHPCFARECKFNTYACQKGIKPEQVISELSKLISK